MTLGGRAAEEIIFGEVTTGASNDLEKVTATAKQMVMRFGMSEKLGPRVFGHDHGQPFLGREFSAEPDYSDEIAREIDDEIRRIVESAHIQAKEILNTFYRTSLGKLSEVLIKRETIDASSSRLCSTARPRSRCSAPRRRPRPRSRCPPRRPVSVPGRQEGPAAVTRTPRPCRRHRRVGRAVQKKKKKKKKKKKEVGAEGPAGALMGLRLVFFF